MATLAGRHFSNNFSTKKHEKNRLFGGIKKIGFSVLRSRPHFRLWKQKRKSGVTDFCPGPDQCVSRTSKQ